MAEVTTKTPAQLQAEEEARQRDSKAQAIGGVLGMLPSIGGAIPNLMRTKQTRELERMQRGQGAGAQAARAAGAEAGRRMAGNVGGRGSSRQIRQGLQMAEKAGQGAGRMAGAAAMQESQLATQLLLGDEARRRGMGLKLGAGLGGAIGAASAMGLAAQDQGPVSEDGVVGGQPQVADATAGPDLDQLEQEAMQADIVEAQEGLTRLRGAREAAGIADATGPGLTPEQAVPVAQIAGDVQAQREQRIADTQSAVAQLTTMTPEQRNEAALEAAGIQKEAAKKKYTGSVAQGVKEPIPSEGGSDDQLAQKAIEDELMRRVELGELTLEQANQAMQLGYIEPGRMEAGMSPAPPPTRPLGRGARMSARGAQRGREAAAAAQVRGRGRASSGS